MAEDITLPGIERAQIVERDNHCISRQQISRGALKVLYTLKDAGFHGFLVGGGVRDLLLGGQPKDFDIASDATPEQLRSLFRNARIIGRRFKIVHIRFGREIIEVTTFRAPPEKSTEIEDHQSRRKIRGLDSAHSTSGMLLRDNVYGNIDEDAWRRDFSVNALYYTIDGFRVLDFCGGLADLKDKSLRMIGNPVERYTEDPVRMLRAIRFAAKLDFKIEATTEEPINKLASLLESVSPARLFDETLKLLLGGKAESTFRLLTNYNIGKYLFAPTIEAMHQHDEPATRLVWLALRNTDSRIEQEKPVTPAFLFAALLWPVLQKRLQRAKSNESNIGPALVTHANEVIQEQLQFTSIPKRFTLAAREIWESQLRLERHTRRTIRSAFKHPRFRAAYDFMLLRRDSGEPLDELCQWWTDF